ncbi:MAG: hypothetical protein Q8N89_09760 [Azonexus sp.]|nr:hypothetical protein [Azonexus sp.]
MSMDAFRVPVEGAEQRRNAGGRRLALFEPPASLASRPAFRVAQGTGKAGAAPGSPFLWLLSFGEAKESTPASKAEPQTNQPASRQQGKKVRPSFLICTVSSATPRGDNRSEPIPETIGNDLFFPARLNFCPCDFYPVFSC